MELIDCTTPEQYDKVKNNPDKYRCTYAQTQTNVASQAASTTEKYSTKGGIFDTLGNALGLYESHEQAINQGANWVKDKFGKNPGDVGYVPTTVPKDDKILGMPKWAAITVGAVLLVGIGFGVYELVKN